MKFSIDRKNVTYQWALEDILAGLTAYRYNRELGTDEVIMLTQDNDTQRFGYVDVQTGAAVNDMSQQELADLLTEEDFRPAPESNLSVVLTS